MIIKMHKNGFSLLEMTVVLVMMGLLMGGLLMPLQAQIEYKKRQQTMQNLSEIKEALIGFALINGRFPCPSVITDPADAGFGVEVPTCSSTSVTRDGYLPWKSLGITETDAWGLMQTDPSGSMSGYWRYRVYHRFSVNFDLATSFSTSNEIKVNNSKGSLLTTEAEAPVAIVYSTGKNLKADGENATYEASGGVYQSDVQSTAFDDMLIWITRPLVMNRMVSAGKLP